MNVSKGHRRLQQTAIGASLGVAVLMLVGKISAYWITGSTAILSDAAESVVHIVATGFAAFSLWYSTRPADRTHPYGHGKIAYFSAGFEGALILFASLVVIYVGAKALIVGPELQQLGIGLLITGILAGINFLLGYFLVYAGKKTSSLVLVANGRHVLTDMWTSLGVLVGVTLVYFTNILWLDPAMAILFGLNILVSAVRLIRRSLQGLLDEADQEQTDKLLTCLNDAVKDDVWLGFHQLRHRETNGIMWIEVHALLPDDMPNLEAHKRATQVEETVRNLFPKYTVNMTTHVEPVTHEKAHPEGHESLAAPFASEEQG
jgi:cation diffusion facilitator family transporter